MNGSIPKIPYPLLDQLDDEEGRMLFLCRILQIKPKLVG